MRSKKAATRIAILGGVLSFCLIAVLLRLHAWLPLLGAGVTSLALLAMLWPDRADERQGPARRLPDDVDPEIHAEALARLAAGSECLRTYARAAPEADAPLFRRMAELLARIRRHHIANPGHATATRPFVQHALGHMLAQIADYMDLVRRAAPEDAERLAEISRGFEAFVPALERIDRACLDNDLSELEINVEVLNEQLNRRR